MQELSPKPEPTTSSNRRGNDRVVWNSHVRVTDPVTKKVMVENAHVKNVSTNGFLLFSNESLFAGSTYNFEIKMQDSTLSLEGRVVYTKPVDQSFTIGIKITSISFFSKSKFNRFLASISSEIEKKFFIYSLISGAIAGAGLSLFFGFSLPVTFASFIGLTTLFFIVLPYN